MLKPRIQSAVVVLVVGSAWLFLTTFAPTPGGFYPTCLVHAATGLHCPGCGSGRALHALAHGNFGAALGYNLFATLFVAVLVPWLAWQGWCAVKYNCFARLSRPAVTGWVAVAAILVFTVARNLPWPPFAWLAPQG